MFNKRTLIITNALAYFYITQKMLVYSIRSESWVVFKLIYSGNNLDLVVKKYEKLIVLANN